MRTTIKSNKPSFSFLTRALFSILTISLIFIAVSAFVVRPVQREKPVPSKLKVKKIAPSPKPTTTDYLLYIMPSAVTKITKKNATYKKDAKGIYTLVEEEGC